MLRWVGVGGRRGLQVGGGGEAREGGRAADGVQNRRRNHVGRQRAHLPDARPRAVGEGARGKREGGVAVAGGVHRVDGAGVPVLGHQGYPAGFRLGEARVGGDHPDGRVPAGRPARWSPCAQEDAGVRQGGPVVAAHARDHPAGRGVDHVAHGVDRHQGGHHQPAGQRDGGATDPAFHRAAHPRQLADGSARARPDAPRSHRIPGRADRGLVPALGSGTHGPVPAHAQIVQDGRAHDRYAHDRADRVSHPLLLQVAHHAAGGVQPEGAAAGEHDGVHDRDGVDRVEQVGLARAGRPSPHIHAPHRAFGRQHHRAPGRTLRKSVVTHPDAGYVGQPAAGSEAAGLLRPHRDGAQEQQGGGDAGRARERRIPHGGQSPTGIAGWEARPFFGGRTMSAP